MTTMTIVHQKDIYKCAVEHGWWEKLREVPELLCLVHSEVSEALEAHRQGRDAKLWEELADVVIRIFDMAEHFNVDIAKVVEVKHRVNLLRAYRHGDKKC